MPQVIFVAKRLDPRRLNGLNQWEFQGKVQITSPPG